ncbi:hypothetical protein EN904_11920 [Mesorhizobium sp. M7A.F.Ca.CA.001.07.2.1]|nr:hypothetical protein EN904_11920 [Mesorhizobium sp. M7A.F.Ca.CA.001.07.2.1]
MSTSRHRISGSGSATSSDPLKLLISPLRGVREWSAQRTESQSLGVPNDERLERKRRAGSGRPEGAVRLGSACCCG